MRDVSRTNFGLLIAFVIPGFVALWGVSPLVPEVQTWLAPEPAIPARIEAIVFLGVASTAAGLTVSGLRWLLVDTLHHLTGLRRPGWDDARLQGNLGAFDVIVEAHYRHYQFYSNAAVAAAIAYATRRFIVPVGLPGWADPAFVAFELAFLVVSRDTLRRYFARTARLLCPDSQERRVTHGKRQPSEAVPAAQAEGQKGRGVRETESLTESHRTGG
jgi:hypothetical protein